MRNGAILALLIGVGAYLYSRSADASNSVVDAPDDQSFSFSNLLPDFSSITGTEEIPVNSANTVSLDALNKIKTTIEKYSATPYPDPPGSGKFSVGYGYQLRNGEWYDFVSPEQADALLNKVAAEDVNTINTHVKVPLNQNQYDAIFMFLYNIGIPAFVGSTFLKYLNAGDYQAAANEFPRWIHSGGVVSNGLITRRTMEQNLFLTA